MNRKILATIIVVFILFGGAVFGQEGNSIQFPGVNNEGDNPKMAVNVDLGYLFAGLLSGGFGIGGGFEFGFSDVISAKASAGFVSASYLGYGWTLIDITGTARFYFFKTGLNGPFAGVGGGVGIYSFTSDYYGVGTSAVWPKFGAEAGYKFTVMNNGRSGFFVEPFVGFFYTISSGVALGGLGGFGFGANLGWSF
jgi:hypothetical protein